MSRLITRPLDIFDFKFDLINRTMHEIDYQISVLEPQTTISRTAWKKLFLTVSLRKSKASNNNVSEGMTSDLIEVIQLARSSASASSDSRKVE